MSRKAKESRMWSACKRRFPRTGGNLFYTNFICLSLTLFERFIGLVQKMTFSHHQTYLINEEIQIDLFLLSAPPQKGLKKGASLPCKKVKDYDTVTQSSRRTQSWFSTFRHVYSDSLFLFVTSVTNILCYVITYEHYLKAFVLSSLYGLNEDFDK